MKKQITVIGIIGILIAISISGCLENKEIIPYETFTVYTSFKEPYNITVYNVSIPLTESEVIIIFETITGESWSELEEKYGEGTTRVLFKSITKIEKGWNIYYGNPIWGVAYTINEQNRTMHSLPTE